MPTENDLHQTLHKLDAAVRAWDLHLSTNTDDGPLRTAVWDALAEADTLLRPDTPTRHAARITHNTTTHPTITLVDDTPNNCGPGEYITLEKRGNTYTEIGEFGTEITPRPATQNPCKPSG